MHKFDISIGDASFTVSLGSKHQNHFNTPINATHFHIDKEIHVVLAGTATMELNGKNMPTRAGDIYIVPENVSHCYKDHSDGFNKISFLFTIVKKRNSKKSFSEYSHYSKIFGSINEYTSLRDGHLTDLGNRIFSLDYSDKSEHINQALYAVFFISLAKLLENQHAAQGKATAKEIYNHKDSCEQKKIIEDFFFKRYSESVTIEDLARALYKSVPQTHRIVKSYFNDNFKTVLIKQRMEQACIIARQGEKTFAEIAFACGYNSYNGFLSAFKKYTGKKPEEYKYSLKNNQGQSTD